MVNDKIKSMRLAWIGFLTFFSIILFFYGVKYLQNESFQNSTVSFKVIFKNSQGIDSGDEVRMLGKKIGYIKATSIIGQNIILDVSISNIYASSIPIDSRFEITSVDIMGGMFLTIYPGKDLSKFILDGDTISGSNSEVVSLTQDIGDFARTLNQTFGLDQKNQIIESISSINKFTLDLEKFMINNQDVITVSDKENLHLILSNFNLVSEKFKNIMENQSDDIAVALNNLSNFSGELPLLSEKMNALAIKFEKIIDNINSGESTLSKLISDDELYNNINSLVTNANDLVLEAKSLTSSIKNSPKTFIRAYFAAKREEDREARKK